MSTSHQSHEHLSHPASTANKVCTDHQTRHRSHDLQTPRRAGAESVLKKTPDSVDVRRFSTRSCVYLRVCLSLRSACCSFAMLQPSCGRERREECKWCSERESLSKRGGRRSAERPSHSASIRLTTWTGVNHRRHRRLAAAAAAELASRQLSASIGHNRMILTESLLWGL